MIRFAGRASAFLLAAGLTVACAELTIPGSSNVSGRKQQAEELVRQGDLAEALVQLKVLETLSPRDPEIAEMRRSVEAETKRLAKSHYEKAEAAAKRSSREAWQGYIAVLAYDPQHEGALRRLRQLELQSNRGNRPRMSGPEAPTKMAYPPPPTEMAAPQTPTQMAGPATAPSPPPREFPKPAAKPEPSATVSTAPGNREADGDVKDGQSLDQAVATLKAGTYLDLIAYTESYLDSHPGDDKAVELLALTHEKAGLALYRDGKLRQSLPHLDYAVKYSGDSDSPSAAALAAVKARLADQTYEQGVRAFRQDISQAIAYWEETLTYDPGHAKARDFLKKAYRIRETLDEIANP